jgi:ribonuclease E
MSDPAVNDRPNRPSASGPAPTDDTPDTKQPLDPTDTAPTDSTRTDGADGQPASGNRRRRGSRGGRNRSRSGAGNGGNNGGANRSAGDGSPRPGRTDAADSADSADSADKNPDELPERHIEGKPRSPEAAERALVKRPQIGDSRPAPATPDATPAADPAKPKRRRRRGGRGRSGAGASPAAPGKPVEAITTDDGGDFDLDDETLEQRRGRERKGKPVGRYLMAVSVRDEATQIAVLEGRNLIEHYVSRPSDDIAQIHGNIYLGKVQNVLPGMEAAFVDIGTPKNAVLYKGDVQYDAEDIEQKNDPRIEQMLKPKQVIVCQVTKNPIAHKGARLTQEVSLPGRFVVLIPNSTTYGISKRLADDERKRLRKILDRVRPKGHGIIVRTAAENVTEEEIERDVARLSSQWQQIEALAAKTQGPALLYREPDMAVRVIREEFNKDYRGVVIDDPALYQEVRDYVAVISPALAERVQLYDRNTEPLSLFERHHVHEQLHKALDPKVWLPSGGSLIIVHTEALTVIDVNTGKFVGSSKLEETVLQNNLEAAEENGRQLRLRDIGGIIVIDFIDIESTNNHQKVLRRLKETLARDKTRTQVFEVSHLGLVEMTRKNVSAGLLEQFSHKCEHCAGRGVIIEEAFNPNPTPAEAAAAEIEA